jgi:hypothetical protein
MSIKWGNGSSNVRTLGMLRAAGAGTEGAAAADAGDAAKDGAEGATEKDSALAEDAEVAELDVVEGAAKSVDVATCP